jgi:HNH endonuclease
MKKIYNKNCLRVEDGSRFKIDKKTGCWIYLMGINSITGYGQYSLYLGKNNYKNVLAHRYFYEKYIKRISKGKILDHLCRNRRCVNPYHLEEVAHNQNTQRGNLSKLDKKSVQEIRKMHKAGVSQYKIAKIFNVVQSNVSRIVNNFTWKNIVYG